MTAVKLGVALARVHPSRFEEVALAAEELGYESVWMSEHLVFPVEMTRSPFPGEDHPPVPPNTPVYDCFAYLAYLAGRTSRIRLGTQVYVLALRHPFVAARAIQTLDVVSGGRAIAGIGAGWLESEFRAAGVDFATRGRRLDEAIAVCKRLWTDEVVEHHGEFFDFEPVMFEPKPVQRPWPPLLVGGESTAALRRAARLADGWVGMAHTPESVAAAVARLRDFGAGDGFDVTIGGPVETPADLERYAAAGVTRVIVAPWERSRDAVAGLQRLAAAVIG